MKRYYLKRWADNVTRWEYLVHQDNAYVELPDLRETTFSEGECERWLKLNYVKEEINEHTKSNRAE